MQTYVVNVARDDTLKLRTRPGTRFAADAADILAFDINLPLHYGVFGGRTLADHRRHRRVLPVHILDDVGQGLLFYQLDPAQLN